MVKVCPSSNFDLETIWHMHMFWSQILVLMLLVYCTVPMTGVLVAGPPVPVQGVSIDI